jgi:pimeloyl-ACP methyl ester carboxylesterase
MQTVTSIDGTEIAYERHGNDDGPPLVLVHGGSGSRHSWDALVPHLADEFAVVVPDRRGRGDSGDADDYGLDREVADVRAVLEDVRGTPTLFGHSFGGLCALEAAREATVERVVLYEPAILVGEHRRGADLAARMQELVDAGDREAAVELFFREATGTADVEQLPVAQAAAVVETVIRENRAIERYSLPDDPLSVPTLLLTGEHGPAHLRDGVRALSETIGDSRLVELDGVGHLAVLSAPALVARELRTFVRDTA